MTRDEELLNEIIQRRGYFVVAGRRRHCPGDRIEGSIVIGDWDKELGTEAVWYVVGQTNLADLEKQVDLLRQLSRHIPFERPVYYPPGYNFYRVLSD